MHTTLCVLAAVVIAYVYAMLRYAVRTTHEYSVPTYYVHPTEQVHTGPTEDRAQSIVRDYHAYGYAAVVIEEGGVYKALVWQHQS